MTANQLSIFVENKPSQIARVTKILAQANIDIRAMSIADTKEFGIVRMIVSDCAKAQEMLQNEGFFSSITKVLCIEIPDHPGGLSKIADCIQEADVNIDYMYACITIIGKCAYVVMHVSDEAKACAVLDAAGIRTVSAEDLKAEASCE